MAGDSKSLQKKIPAELRGLACSHAWSGMDGCGEAHVRWQMNSGRCVAQAQQGSRDSPFSDSSTGTFPAGDKSASDPRLFAFASMAACPRSWATVLQPCWPARSSCLVVDPHRELTFASSVPTDIVVLSSSCPLGIRIHLVNILRAESNLLERTIPRVQQQQQQC